MTTNRLTRRGLLAGGLSAWAGLALAEAPLRPLARPGSTPVRLDGPPQARPLARPDLDGMIRAAGLEGRVSVALVEMDSGTILAAHDAQEARPPASVAKALTALYALDALGAGHRFATRLLATGPVADGVLDGDLILAGGGDPTLDTDTLATLARSLAASGITEARGFRVWGGALPLIREIDPGQLDHLAYNPALSGLNLNHNRLYFEWTRRAPGQYDVTLDARGEAFRPAVTMATMRVEPRSLPVYTYAQEGEADAWTVASGQLGEGGSRWLPVRNPALYAGQAFQSLAALAGVTLPTPTALDAAPEGTELARLESAPLEDILRDMLLHSTNLTAEVVGLSASLARGLSPATLADSAGAMNRWLREATGARLDLVDHSGLGGGSRVSAQEMALALASRGAMERLRPLLRTHVLTDAAGEALPFPPGLVRAKTGTLNFVSALAGYERTMAGTDLAFAIFAADVERREAAARTGDEIPPGSREFLSRARRLQQALLQRWGLMAG